MYRNILASILIVLVAARVIGGVTGSHKLSKASVVGIVLLASAAAILWLLMGLSPVPGWLTKFVERIVHQVVAAVQHTLK